MSREIDERVVQMKFEKGQFERGIQTSINSLDKLKSNLNFEDAINGFNELDDAARSVSIGSLGDAVEQVRLKFSFLDVLAIKVMNRISDAILGAANSAKNLVTSLTIDQITPGWDKYADKTTAVQTIMAATAKQFTDTGEQMAFVNEQLDKLNWFTDETSYNFVDMVSNIGKFTANNIALDDSVTAMQGIANWAAISGADANAASRAMYNLSQAISSGSLRLQDWMSIENANMGTAAFKEMAIQSGLAAGTLIKNGEKITTANGKVEVSVESFRETLSEKWLSSDVLMNTLNEYGAATNKLNEIYEETGILTSGIVAGIDEYMAGTKTAAEVSEDWGISLEKTQEYLDAFNNDTMQFGLKAFKAAQEAKTFADAINSVKDAVSTGWMKSFEYIFGDYTEAKELWTDLANNLYDIFAESGNARNEMLKAWKGFGGRDLFIDSIWAGLAAILRILGPIKQAWDDVFGIDAQGLFNITLRVRDFLVALNITEDSMTLLRSTAKGFFSIFSIIGSVIGSAARAFGSLLQYFLPFGNSILYSTASLGEFIAGLDATIKETKIFDKIFGGIVSTITGGIDKLSEFYHSLFKNKDGFTVAAPGLVWFTDSLINLIKNGFERFISIGGTVKDILKAIRDAIFGAIPDTATLSEAISGLFKAFTNPFKSMDFNKAIDLINAGLFTTLIVNFRRFTDQLKTLKIKDLFGDTFKDFSGFFKNLGKGIEEFQGKLKADTLRSIAVSILILAGALAVLAAINPERLSGALISITALFGELAAEMIAFNALLDGKKAKGVSKFGKIMITAAISVLILASAVKKLADLDWNGLIKGLTGVGILMAELVASIKILSNGTPRVIKGATSLILFATAIRILVSSVKALSDISWDGLIKGLTGVGALMVELGAFLSLVSSNLKLTSGISLIALAAAISILTGSIEKLGNISTGAVVQGLISLGALFTELSLFVNSMNWSKHVMSTATAMLVLSFAIKGFASAVSTLGTTDPEMLAIGLTAMAAALIEISIASNLIPKNMLSKSIGFVVMAGGISVLAGALVKLGDISSLANSMISLGWALMLMVKSADKMKDSTQSAIAMTIFAAALAILVPAVKSFSNMKLGEIVTMIIAMGSAFAILGVAAKFLEPLTPAIKSLSVSIALFSASVLLLGTGITILSVGLSSLGTSAVIGVGGLVVALTEIINIIPTIVEALGKGVIMFANVIIEGAPVIAKAVSTLILSTLETIAEIAPQIVDLVIDIITQVAAAIAGRLDDLRAAGKLLFGGFSEGVASGIKDVVSAVSLLIPSIVAAVKLLGGSKGMEKGAMSTLLGMIAIVGTIGLLLIAFSHIPMGNINNAVTIASGIAILMPVLAGSFSILTRFGGTISMSAVGQFAIISAIAVALGACISLIGQLKGVDNALKVSEALTILVPTLVASFVLLTKFSGKISAATVAQFALITALAMGAGALVAMIGSINGVENAITAASAIAAVMVPLAAVVAILSLTGAAASSAWGSLIMLAAIVGVLTVVALGVGALMQDPSVKAIIMDSGAGMVALGNAIGGFVGGILGGLIYGALSFLPQLGAYLSEFMQEAQVFIDGAKNIPDNLGENVKNIAVALLALTAADLLNGVANFANWVFGDNANNLVEKFGMFGEAISAFSDSISDTFDPDKVEAAANAGKALSELESNLPRQGGKLQEWLGSQDLSQFGERIKIFGTALMEFANSITDLNADDVTAAAEAGKLLVELEKNLPAQNGVLQQMIGNKSFSDFGPALTDLGEGLVSFSMSLSGVSVERINNATECIRTLVAMEHDVDNSGGWGEIFTGKSDFSSFGQHIINLGNALSKYNGTITDVNVATMQAINGVIDRLLEIAKISTSYGGYLSSLAINLQTYSTGLLDYNNAIESMNTAQMENVRYAIEKLLKLSSLTNASTWIRDIINYCSQMVSKIIDTIESKEPYITSISEDMGKWLVAGVKKGINDNQQDAIDAAATLGTKIKEAFEDKMEISSPSAVMEEDGKWIVQGVAEGIKKDTSAEDAIKKKAENIKTAFESTMKTYNLASTTADLNFQLWELTDGANASQADIFEHQITVFKADLDKLLANVQTQKATATALGQLWGLESAEYQEALNNVTKAQIDLRKKINEVNEYQSSMSVGGSSDRDMMNAFAQRAKEYDQLASMMGWTHEEAMKKAGEAVGFDYTRATEYQRIIDENQEAAQMLNWSTEQLIEFAKAQSGYTGLVQQATSSMLDTSAYWQSALAEQSVTLENSVQQSVGTAIANGIKKGTEQIPKDMEEAGNDAVNGYNNGLSDPKTMLETAGISANIGKTSYNALMDYLNAASPSKLMLEVGQFAVQGYAIGFGDKTIMENIISSASMIADKSISPFADSVPGYEIIGLNAMEGFKQGINEKGTEAIQAAISIANQVAAAMAAALKVKSPSRVTTEIGRFVGIGLANGISETTSNVQSSVEAMANNTISSLEYAADAISTILSSDEDFQPVITPVLDMDELKKQADTIPGLLSSDRSISLNSARLRVGQINAGKEESTSQNGSNASNQTNYSFVQNNYSPKALNRLEIYRQTNNQFSRIKEATKR